MRTGLRAVFRSPAYVGRRIAYEWKKRGYLPRPSAREQTAIDELRARIAVLPPLAVSRDTDPAARFWIQQRRALREYLSTEDPRTFLDSSVVRSTMFVDSPDFIAAELASLRHDPRWNDRWRHALLESPSIVKPPCAWSPAFTGNLIHQASHIQMFEQATGADVSRLGSVLEFGGGYGGLCGLIHRLGFKGRYAIRDLPEFGALQRFYLALNDLGLAGGAGEAIHFIEDADATGAMNHSPDLFVALWSISETPESLRREILDAIEPSCWLIAFQRHWGHINNHEFFQRWSESRPQWTWSCKPIPHIPSEYYLVGVPTRTERNRA